jgi:hypothetical protein
MMGALAGALVAAGVGQVVLRGIDAAPAGAVSAVDLSGVVIGEGGSARVVGWDRVKSVGGDKAEAATAFAQTADAAWRARTRLERGDFIAAEPLFERLFEEYRGQSGPTAAVVAEGLLRCRVRRAAHVAAVDPWLALLAARQGVGNWDKGEWASEAGLGSVLDAGTGLCPSVPPIFLNWPSVAAWARMEGASAAEPQAAALAQLYLASARFEAGMPAALPAAGVNDAGVQIVREIVTARIGNAEERAEARGRLMERLRKSGSAALPAWLEAWCRAGVGRSLVRESSAELRRLGVVELLHLPARFGRTHPYLAGVALAEAAAVLRELGDQKGADVLTAELAAQYPTHPVREWDAVRGRGSLVPAATVLPPRKPAEAGERSGEESGGR